MANPAKKARYDVSSQVKDAMERDDWAEVARILSECSRRDSDSVMTQLVSRDQWDAVKHVIRCVGDEERTWDIEGVLVKNNILLSVAEGNWRGIGEMLHERFLRSTLEWILQQACTRAKQTDIVLYVLPHCEDDQLDSALQQLVTHGLWFAAGRMLQRPVSDERVRWMIQQACGQAEELALRVFVIPFCPKSNLDLLMTELVSRDMWQAAGCVLMRGVSDTQHCWVLKEACCRAQSWQLERIILPYCALEHCNSTMNTLFSEGKWSSVCKLLDCTKDQRLTITLNGVYVDRYILHLVKKRKGLDILTLLRIYENDSKCVWSFCQNRMKKSQSDFQLYCRQHDSRLKRVRFNNTCTRTSGQVFPKYIPDLKNVFAVILKLCPETNEQENRVCIVPSCTGKNLDSIFTQCFDTFLEKNSSNESLLDSSDFQVSWTVRRAHLSNAQISKVSVSRSTDQQLYSALRHMLSLPVWWALGKVLEQGLDDHSVTQILKQTLLYDDDQIIVEHVLPHCTDSQTDLAMTELVSAGQWESVTKLVTLVGDRKQTWTVGGTSVDTTLLHLVAGGRWRKVGDTLHRGVDDKQHRWLIQIASHHASSTHFLAYVLPHCADDQLHSVLTALVERQLWRTVEKVLKRGVSDSVIRWAVEKACQLYNKSYHVDNVDNYIVNYILPHCANNQLDSVLTTLVERRRWWAVGKVLTRVGHDMKKDLSGQETCEHCRSAGVYFSEYRVHDSDRPVQNAFIQHCADGNLNSLTSTLTKTDECTAVRNMSGREVSDAQRRENIRAAFRKADENTLIKIILPYYVYGSIHSALRMLASRGFLSAFLVLLHSSIIDTLYMWIIAKDTTSTDEVFCDMVRNPCIKVKGLTPAMWRSVTWSGLQRSLKQVLDWDTPLCEVLCESMLAIAKEVWLSGREGETDVQERVMKEALSTVEHLHQEIAPVPMKCKTYHVSDLLLCIECLRHAYSNRRSGRCFLLQLYFIKHLVHQYYKRKAWTQMTDAILIVLTTVPVAPDVQSVALRVMLRHNRWDVIKHACLSGLCEQDRRQLFQAAVKQRQWSAVKRWADHTLYDDQRLWALGEARQEKQWDVYLKLADHGLSEWERVGVLFRVTMHADWKLVHHMLRTVADVTDMIDLLTNTPGTLAKLGAKNYKKRMNELKVFENNLKKDTHALRTLKTMAKRGKWWVVLHNIRHKPNLQHARRALKAAVSSEAWHAVMQLVKLETDVTRRDSLFRDMVRLRQWAVCRELLQQGVSRQLCLQHLPELLEHSQWTVVAVVMECPMDDESRKKIMHQAIMMREGSVVWECINKLQTRLSVDEREDMFQLSFNREVWQAVKPLIEEKDDTGIRHRDTALLEAIEQHQWDVVDHCQRHHADINMKDDDGHTPIHRAARKGDWEAVKELTMRDGDPNLLDREGLSVLHRAIRAEQWDAVKLLIQFHGDIHQAARQGSTPPRILFDNRHDVARTPLQMLIDARQGEAIETSLMWCPDQHKVVNYKEETVLHAVCLSGWPGALYHLIARKVDPLAVTTRRHTALCYAVLCKDCPQRMVAECIMLGFGTHQPHITEAARTEAHYWKYARTEPRMLMSPVMLAVIRGLPGVTQMLYQSGACSGRELFELSICVSDLSDDAPYTGKAFLGKFNEMWRTVNYNNARDYSFDKERMQQSADYLREMCRTPRSLVSTCRLVISRCLTLSKTRHRDIAQLPLSPRMRNYLMFSDLTDPRYPDLSHRGKE